MGPLAPASAFPARALALPGLVARALVCEDCGAVVVGTPAQVRRAASAERQYQQRLMLGEQVKREASARRMYAPRNAQCDLFAALSAAPMGALIRLPTRTTGEADAAPASRVRLRRTG